MTAKRMPIGIDNFEKLRENNFYYVDKTGLIKELLENWGEVNLFTRPRRFGKSMNMSMLKYFFGIGTNTSLFDGLEISKETELCDKYMGKYPVISVSLKQVSGNSYERAEANLRNIISIEARRFPELLKSEKLDEEDISILKSLRRGEGLIDYSLYNLSRMLHTHYGKKVIILIDEYDAPLQRAYEKNYYDEKVTLNPQLLGYPLKSNESLFFSGLTGCMRVSKESIFSDLNNPAIHSISDKQFDEWFGFTDEEVRQMLDELSLTEYYDITKEWYDGYLFGLQSVYCPWDVINWCNQLMNTPDRIPKNYWVNSGSTDIIRDFAEIADGTTRDEIGDLIEGKAVRKFLTPDLTYRDMMDKPENVWSVLYTAGYLTTRRQYDDGSFDLCIPNREVQNIFVTKINEWFTEKVVKNEDGLKEFFTAFDSGDAAALENHLNYLLGKSISYLDGGKYEEKETFYHGLLLGILNTRRDWEIKSNREAGNGRADILAYNFRTREAYIIEVKYSRTEYDLKTDVQKALDQINAQEYDRYYEVREPKSIKHYGIAFCKKQCRVLSE